MTRGRFIVFEGLDGAGTTTQCQLLGHWLESQGRRGQLSGSADAIRPGPVRGTIRRNVHMAQVVSPILGAS